MLINNHIHEKDVTNFNAYLLLGGGTMQTKFLFFRECILVIWDGKVYRFDKGTEPYNYLADMHDYVVAFLC